MEAPWPHGDSGQPSFTLVPFRGRVGVGRIAVVGRRVAGVLSRERGFHGFGFFTAPPVNHAVAQAERFAPRLTIQPDDAERATICRRGGGGVLAAGEIGEIGMVATVVDNQRDRAGRA